MSGPEQTLWSIIKDTRIVENYWLGKSKRSHSLTGLYAAMRQFDKISIHLICRHQEGIYIACRLLHNFLQDASTIMSISKDDQQVPAPWLKACRMLKCKSIDFPGYDAPCDQSSTEATKRLIQSNKHVVDTYDLLRTCLATFAKIHLVKPFVPKPKMHHYGNLLISAAFDHSEKRIAKYRPQFVEAAEIAIETWASGRRADLQRRQEEFEKMEAKMLEAVEKVI